MSVPSDCKSVVFSNTQLRVILFCTAAVEDISFSERGYCLNHVIDWESVPTDIWKRYKGRAISPKDWENIRKGEDNMSIDKYELKLHRAEQVCPIASQTNLGDSDLAFYSGKEEYAAVSWPLQMKAGIIGFGIPFPMIDNGLFYIGPIKNRGAFVKFWREVKAASWPSKEYSTIQVENIKL